ncbi:GspH/FimT family pseudopilin [Stutzerimonas nitrititolerans]|uniref:GspH/FimT family pseudopilin n=1 Tax=Stutzerimonas nitrititolerans TaxID=2482751 RepID=UPI0028AA1678|nr:GspH/FimT family pseudopilin [Stutzerimonas nitrititolerans]
MHITRGFTLIELMVTIAVLAVVIAIAAPSFTSVIQSNRATALHHEVLGAIQLARSEAVKRRKDVIVCRTEDQEDCANGADWSTGWLIREVGGDVVKVQDPIAGMALTGPNAGVLFHSSGMTNAVTNFTTTTSSCTTGTKYTIEVSLTGSPTIDKTGCP